ncbi:TetR/AcrR family transcriptional regulator [Streptomyces sp. NPDC006553]|uniref:TetR/AcrR family transcriptional regulator n=1 Tax=unclassified Streptomyces TaxID=2593676 RepID=UPI0022537259|nr:TetR/AcrR family transcriptional regulator [Streptomyces sp. NBC_00233]MCX5232748.1 TetR/AcrR family transcriptional regulator [Streptomyces sp. NBC_00233]
MHEDRASEEHSPARRERSPASRASARKRLTADDWADAALAALGERGLAAVAVEPLAARLGTTKGSFYWHFANRDALVVAALARWEEQSTERIITAMEAAEPDPAARLAALLRGATASAAGDPLEVRLLAAADHPEVAAALARVTERRVGYLAHLFELLGFPPAEARGRGFFAYTSYLGHAQLAHAAPGALPADGDYLTAATETLLRR